MSGVAGTRVQGIKGKCCNFHTCKRLTPSTALAPRIELALPRILVCWAHVLIRG